MLQKAILRQTYQETEFTRHSSLGDLLLDPSLHSTLDATFCKKVNTDQVTGFGKGEHGVIAIALAKDDTKKLKKILDKTIKGLLPNAIQEPAKESPEHLEIDFLINIINVSKESACSDGRLLVKSLNQDKFAHELMAKMTQAQLPTEIAINTKATSVPLTLLELHLEWDFAMPSGETSVGPVRNYLDGVCMAFSESKLAQVIDYRSAHDFHMLHDGEETPATQKLCRAISAAMKHSGDLSSDTQGEHRIRVDLSALPPQVTELYFVLSAFECDDLSLFVNPTVEIHDMHTNRQLSEYNISSAGHAQAVVMCSLSRSYGHWIVNGLGIPTDGGVSDYTPIRRALSKLQERYAIWDRRKDWILLRVLHKHRRITKNSTSESALLLWYILDMPTALFQYFVRFL